jgi:hypothetical protein
MFRRIADTPTSSRSDYIKVSRREQCIPIPLHIGTVRKRASEFRGKERFKTSLKS